jgi:hypothetical protein
MSVAPGPPSSFITYRKRYSTVNGKQKERKNKDKENLETSRQDTKNM